MNQITKTLTINFFLLIIFCSGRAQFSEKLFYDTLTKVSSEGYVHSAITEGKYIYIAGGSFSDKSPLPTLTKMDTSGNVIWTAIDNDNYGRFGKYIGGENARATCRETIKSGNRLYSNVRGIGSFFMPQLNEIWCISDSSGSLLWKVGINNKLIVNIADYSSTEIIAITGIYSYEYHLINKNTGAVTFSKYFGAGDSYSNNRPNIFVDNNQNILLSWEDTCRKYKDKFLTQLAWTSHVPNMGSRTMIDKVIQDSSRFIFLGRNNVRSVDTLTGNTVWLKRVQVGFVLGSQSGSDGDPKDVILKDSLIYVTWVSPYVGGVNLEKGFTMTRLNKYNSFISLNVAYDFNGIPADPIPNLNDDLDWPFQMSMDENKNIYITGSYDRDPGMESPGNWGIMKINGSTGSKVYEATITDDSTRRQLHSQGRFIYNYNGKIYAAGNLSKKEDYLEGTKPIIISFDTSSVFNQLYRKSIDCLVRYPSALVGMTNLSATKMVLLKKVGRSGIIEVRNTSDQLIWSKPFSTTGKYVVPQNVENLNDTSIVASFVSYLQDTSTKMLQGKPDSLLFVRMDTLGNILFQHKISYLNTDTLSALQIYKDNRGKTNFFYRQKNGQQYSTSAYMLNGTGTTLSVLGNYQIYDTDSAVMRINPVQHYNGDSLISYQSGPNSRGWIYSNTQTPTGYAFLSFKPLRDFAKVYSAVKLDSVSFFITGRDSSGRITGARYNHRLSDQRVWTYFGSPGTMYNADMSASSVYTVSKNYTGNNLSIARLNRQTGSISWTTEKTPATKTNILPSDIKYDQVNRFFITAGVIADSSVSGIRTSYFYFTVDSLGNIIKDVVRTGHSLNETKINVVNVLQNGTHAFGGVISTPDWGIAGFYNSDCFVNNLIPTVSISTPSTNICSGSSVTFTASVTHEGPTPVYQWQVNGSNTGNNSNTFTTSSLNNNDQVKVILTSNASCLQTSSATSNIITMTVNTQGSSVTIAGTTTVTQGQNTMITASPLNAGATPAYQWQDSTSTHTWQNINGAINSSITYTPLLTGDKIRCAMTGSAMCSAPGQILSNTLTFTVNAVTAINPVQASNYGIIYYPNPAHSILTVDSLKLSDKWETLKIISIDGRQHQVLIDIKNQRKISVDVGQLTNGLYIAILYRKQKEPVYLKFMKL